MTTAVLVDSAPADSSWQDEFDAVDEIRLRTWARHNYAPANERDEDWHPVVLDEMERIDSGA